jgi:hypothetical protein
VVCGRGGRAYADNTKHGTKIKRWQTLCEVMSSVTEAELVNCGISVTLGVATLGKIPSFFPACWQKRHGKLFSPIKLSAVVVLCHLLGC